MENTPSDPRPPNLRFGQVRSPYPIKEFAKEAIPLLFSADKLTQAEFELAPSVLGECSDDERTRTFGTR
jgi:hypothetical protein